MESNVEENDPSVIDEITSKSLSIYPRKCENCSKIFKNRHSFCNHRIACSGALIICEDCSHVYRSRLAFYEHNCQKRRKNGAVKRFTKCIAPNCESKFFRRTEMLKHMEAVHANNIEEAVLHFSSIEEFEKWKESESQKCFTYFRKQRGTKKLRDTEYSSFVCQFDAPNRKKGSKIPNYSCPARMQVSRNENGEVSVRYISTHNHSLTHANTKFHPYSKTVVNYIKELLNNGVSPKTVYNVLKGKCNEPDFFQLKDHSITVKYINNIKYQLKSKGKLKEKSPYCKSKHKIGLEIPTNNVISLSSSTWHVSSQSDENVSYVVEKFYSECPQPENCLYRCNYSICDSLCSHMYNCSCSDPGSLCKHIHRIQSLNKKKHKIHVTGILLKMEEEEENEDNPIDVDNDDIHMSEDVHIVIDENETNKYNSNEKLNEEQLQTNFQYQIHESEENIDTLSINTKNKISLRNDEIIDINAYEDKAYLEIVMNEHHSKEIVIEDVQDIPSDLIEVEITNNISEEQLEENEQRAVGRELLNNLSQAYIQASPSTLPEFNKMLNNVLENISKHNQICDGIKAETKYW